MNKFKNGSRRLLVRLADLRLALSTLLAAAIAIFLESKIPQGQSLEFYKIQFPVATPIYGFINWKVIEILDLDAIYSTWWYRILVLLLMASLISCSLTTQIPTIKKMRILQSYDKVEPPRFGKQIEQKVKPFGMKEYYNVLNQCYCAGYTCYQTTTYTYILRGLFTLLGPVAVHISICMGAVGSLLDGFLNSTSTLNVGDGTIFHTGKITKRGLFPVNQSVCGRINALWQEGSSVVADITLLDSKGNEKEREVLFPNQVIDFKSVVIRPLDSSDNKVLKMRIQDKNENKFEIDLNLENTLEDKNPDNFTDGLKFIPNNEQINIRHINKSFRGNLNVESGKSNYIVKYNLKTPNTLFFYNQKNILLKRRSIGDLVSLENDLNFRIISVTPTLQLELGNGRSGEKLISLGTWGTVLSTYISSFPVLQIWLTYNRQKTDIAGRSNRPGNTLDGQINKVKYLLNIDKLESKLNKF